MAVKRDPSLTVQTASLWTLFPIWLLSSSEPKPVCPCSGLPCLLSSISLTAASLGHRGEPGAAVRLHPEAAEREEPLPAGHERLGPPEAPAPPQLQQAQASDPNHRSAGGDGGGGAGNQAVGSSTDVCMEHSRGLMGENSACLRKQG